MTSLRTNASLTPSGAPVVASANDVIPDFNPSSRFDCSTSTAVALSLGSRASVGVTEGRRRGEHAATAGATPLRSIAPIARLPTVRCSLRIAVDPVIGRGAETCDAPLRTRGANSRAGPCTV
jgi:hypothetical protein